MVERKRQSDGVIIEFEIYHHQHPLTAFTWAGVKGIPCEISLDRQSRSKNGHKWIITTFDFSQVKLMCPETLKRGPFARQSLVFAAMVAMYEQHDIEPEDVRGWSQYIYGDGRLEEVIETFHAWKVQP